MKKSIYVLVGLILAILLAGIIRFNFTNDDIYVENGAGNVVKYERDQRDKIDYQSEVMLKLFSIKTADDLVISIPISDTPPTKAAVRLTSFADFGTARGVAQGDYAAGEERGQVIFYYMKITTVHLGDPSEKIYFVAPFSVSNQGSGVFYYIGLFVQDINKMNIRHLASHYIGDRIKVMNIENFDEQITVSFITRTADTSYADKPDQSQFLTLTVTTPEQPKLVLYKGMHPSWDLNLDGMNDCEDEGSCDHSINYTEPRP
jgi:hypothetical protein